MSKWRGQLEGHEAFVQRTDASDEGLMAAQQTMEDIAPTTAQIPADRKANAALTANGSSERADIARRVVAFRDRQRLIRQEREDYCNAVQAETRAALRDHPGISRN